MATSYYTYANPVTTDEVLVNWIREQLKTPKGLNGYNQNKFDPSDAFPQVVESTLSNGQKVYRIDDENPDELTYQAYLKASGSTGVVYMEYAEGCSKPRSSECLGHIRRITADAIEYASTKTIAQRARDEPALYEPYWHETNPRVHIQTEGASHYCTAGNNLSVSKAVRAWMEENFPEDCVPTGDCRKRFSEKYPQFKDQPVAELEITPMSVSLDLYNCDHNLNIDWCYENRSLNAVATAAMLQMMLREANSQELIVFDWLVGCWSGNDENLFGGVCCVTKDRIVYTTTKDLIEMSMSNPEISGNLGIWDSVAKYPN